MNQDNNSNNFNGMGNGFNNQMPNPNDGLGNQAMQNNNGFNSQNNGFNNFQGNNQNNQQNQFNNFQSNNGIQNNGFNSMNNNNVSNEFNGYGNQGNSQMNSQFNGNNSFQNNQGMGAGNMNQAPASSKSNNGSKKNLPIVIVALVVIAAGVGLYFGVLKGEVVTCTSTSDLAGISYTSKAVVNFKNDKAIKASAEMVFDLSSQNTTIVDEFYNSLKESGEKEYGSKFNISKKDKTIMVEMSASSKEDEFEAVLSTSTDTTLDNYIKTMEANSFTCKKK